MKATNEYICNARGYASMKDTYFKLGGDDGRGFFKINGTIQNMIEKPKSDMSDSSSDDDDKKWSYKKGVKIKDFSDGGVERLTIFGKIFT